MSDVKTPIEPTVEHVGGPNDADLVRHPAYAMIGGHRSTVMGGTDSGVYLYGSDFRHRAVITIRIHESEMTRQLGRDWPSARRTIAEVTLSEAQWATFVSSLNAGDGVPCTLDFSADRGHVPGIAPPKARIEQASGEIIETLNDAIGILDGLLAEIAAKGRATDLRARIAKARQEIVDNLPYVAGSFDRHMEGTVEKAKSEVHGYMTGVLMRAGLTQLAAPENLPLQLEDGNAQVDRNPEGEKPQALSAKHESPVVADDAPEHLGSQEVNNGLG